MIPRREPRRRPLALVVAISLATAPVASALAGPAEDKATARELAQEGIAAAQAGDCATAIDRLERAEALYHAPPHLQFLGRCYAKAGRLVEATEAYRKLTLETLPPNAPAAFKAAVAEATTELPKIEPRLGRLTVSPSKAYPELAVDVDGKAWPSAALGVPRVIDPGSHVITATAKGFAPKEQTVDVGEGANESVTLTLSPSATTTSTTTAPTAPTTPEPPPASPWRTAGWVTAGVGAAAALAGGVTYLVAWRQWESLEADCPDNRCPAGTDVSGRGGGANQLVDVSRVLAIGGGALAAAGVAMILLAPASPAQDSSSADKPKAVAFAASPSPTGGHVSLTITF